MPLLTPKVVEKGVNWNTPGLQAASTLIEAGEQKLEDYQVFQNIVKSSQDWGCIWEENPNTGVTGAAIGFNKCDSAVEWLLESLGVSIGGGNGVEEKEIFSAPSIVVSGYGWADLEGRDLTFPKILTALCDYASGELLELIFPILGEDWDFFESLGVPGLEPWVRVEEFGRFILVAKRPFSIRLEG